jgi:Na+-transporting NADH:ubiquinone oxidoreductase subunit NqrE
LQILGIASLVAHLIACANSQNASLVDQILHMKILEMHAHLGAEISHMQILEMLLLLYNTKVKCKLGSSFPFFNVLIYKCELLGD